MIALTLAVVAALVALALVRLTLPYRHGAEDRFEGGEMVETDRELGYAPARQSGGVRTHAQSRLRYHVFADARGARVNAAGDETPDHVDLLVLGCSYAWGHGVESEVSFPQVLARSLDTSVANFAFAGFGGVQAMLLLERHRDLAPRVVIYAFTRDHLRRNLAPCAPARSPFCVGQAHIAFDASGAPRVAPPELRYVERWAEPFEREVVGRGLGLQSIVWGARIAWVRLLRRDLRDPPADPVSRRRAMQHVLARMKSAAQSSDASLLVVHVPTLARGWSDPPPAELLEALPPGVLFLDTSPAVARYYRDPAAPTLTLDVDAHPGPAGHALLADSIGALLREHGLP